MTMPGIPAIIKDLERMICTKKQISKFVSELIPAPALIVYICIRDEVAQGIREGIAGVNAPIVDAHGQTTQFLAKVVGDERCSKWSASRLSV